MIHYFYENISPISDEEKRAKWIEDLILNEGKKIGSINYILCDDEYLLQINKEYLNHDYYTDIISFNYCKGKNISGDIFVSLQRILDNSSLLKTKQEDELNRVLAHGVLHLCGYNDKTEEEQRIMRNKEDYYIGKY
ncbi:rRNA maturation RNase YbeY [Elizabethkingia argentiflava]|uniref:Endoribonuclease YbeY n=1 Tax=Elizabethkingia argenteiflava TaxID=2681556 RepID=A0A845PYY1_9FLAO|nr:rRNA maturation RNase YbeY [Elizabethkingia argenteiflava]NAW51568.1 rRNA maturation RNase YbeY [Elizabethkingia argenteiflava]